MAGCLAHGGLGWIYLARDKNVSNRWVVLKGLLNSGDPDALAAAIAEQRFLAQVSHPHIVEIYNFVTHDDAGYIVMEYVGGTSLKSILKQRMRRSGRYDPIPADQALAYIIEILPAFQYLHDLGLVYCDFKPDNLIQVGDMIKLIDLGGVRRIDDDDSAIFGTVGYQAPEVAAQGTTVASDIYTIGRTLVVLMMEFRGYQSTYVDSLPPVESDAAVPEVRLALPVAAQGLRHVARRPVRLGRRAARADARCAPRGRRPEPAARAAPPARRRRCCSRNRPSRPTGSTGIPSPACASTPPTPRPAGSTGSPPKAPRRSGSRCCTRLLGCRRRSTSRICRAALAAGQADLVDSSANAMLRVDPWEWRAVWMQGLSALQQGDPRVAQSAVQRGLRPGPR